MKTFAKNREQNLIMFLKNKATGTWISSRFHAEDDFFAEVSKKDVSMDAPCCVLGL